MLGLFGLRSVVLSLSPAVEEADLAPPMLPRSAATADVLAYARSLVGSPYRGGGCTPKGFDCSGFVQHVFAEAGYRLPRSSRGMAQACEPVDLNGAVPGDLLFFAGRDGNKSRIGHVALLLECRAEVLYLIHATERGVVIDRLGDMPYYQQRLIMAGQPLLTPK